LRHQQKPTLIVLQTGIHAPGAISKHPIAEQALGETLSTALIVIALNPNQHQKPRLNGRDFSFIDAHSGMTHPL
jgi:hypothetical protein